jgi:hypothetical protein
MRNHDDQVNYLNRRLNMFFLTNEGRRSDFPSYVLESEREVDLFSEAYEKYRANTVKPDQTDS